MNFIHGNTAKDEISLLLELLSDCQVNVRFGYEKHSNIFITFETHDDAGFLLWKCKNFFRRVKDKKTVNRMNKKADCLNWRYLKIRSFWCIMFPIIDIDNVIYAIGDAE